MRSTKLFSVILCALIIASVFVGCKKDEPKTPSLPGGAGRTVVTDTNSVSDVVSDTDAVTTGGVDNDITTDTDNADTTDTEEESSVETDTPAPTGDGESVAALAKQLIGTTFQLGASGPDHFDNPGFVYYCCKQNGIVVPRSAAELANTGSSVPFSDLAPGDILVFSAEPGGAASFVAVYVGNNCFVACFKPERPTNIQAIDAWWSERFITARRVG